MLKVGVESGVVLLERDGDAVPATDGCRYIVGPNEIVGLRKVGVVEAVGLEHQAGAP